MSHKYCVMLSTCPDNDCAEALAALLVERQLAACVNIVPGLRSIYQWQGERHSDAEVLLIIKTRSELSEAVQQALVSAHPYELPEVIALPVTAGLPGYLDWIDAQLATTN